MSGMSVGQSETSNPDKETEQAAAGSSSQSGRNEQTGSREAGSGEPGVSDDALGACGGSSRPLTVSDVLKQQNFEQMYAVQPLPWCPHLETVQPLPSRALNTTDPCEVCGDQTENWVCLVCYKVYCSRFVNEHMLFHGIEENHLMVLSYADLSVWCYGCDHYVDNQIIYPMKRAAHRSKFGEDLPNLE